jgi:chlorobactene glucosyltransferase
MHEAVRTTSIEDLAFARLVKRQRLPWLFLNLSSRVQTRMYRNTTDTFSGISKNLFAVFNHRPIPFTFAWLWLLFVFTQPILGLILLIFGYPIENFSVRLALTAIALSLLLWGLNNWRFQMPIAYAVFYPLTVLFYILMAARSFWAYYTKRSTTWKGRQLTAEERKS